MLIKKIRNYVSEADQFLKQYDQDHPDLSASQKDEMAKHQRISELRDHVPSHADEPKLWEDF